MGISTRHQNPPKISNFLFPKSPPGPEANKIRGAHDIEHVAEVQPHRADPELSLSRLGHRARLLEHRPRGAEAKIMEDIPTKYQTCL